MLTPNQSNEIGSSTNFRGNDTTAFDFIRMPTSRTVKELTALTNCALGICRDITCFLPKAYSICQRFNASYRVDLDESGNRQPPCKELKPLKIAAGAGLGGMLYDLSHADYGRKVAQTQIASLVSVIAVVDFHIDELSFPLHTQIELINGFRHALIEGSADRFGLPQYDFALQIAALLHREVASHGRQQTFCHHIDKVCTAGIEALQKHNDVRISERVGGHCLAAILALPLSFTSHIDERLITGCWHFGAFTQLLDHVNDFEADRAKCRPTPLAENPFHGITPHEIAIRAKQHFAQAMHNFTPEQKPYFQALAILGKLYWNF